MGDEDESFHRRPASGGAQSSGRYHALFFLRRVGVYERKIPPDIQRFYFWCKPLFVACGVWGGGERVFRVLVALGNCTVLIRGWEKHSLEEFGEDYLSLDRQVCP